MDMDSQPALPDRVSMPSGSGFQTACRRMEYNVGNLLFNLWGRHAHHPYCVFGQNFCLSGNSAANRKPDRRRTVFYGQSGQYRRRFRKRRRLVLGGVLLGGTGKQRIGIGAVSGAGACTRIPYGRGVCGQAWAGGKAVVVEDVNRHPDHITCSSLSQSEIVIPLFDRNCRCFGVLDADSDRLAQFDETDARYLNQLAELVGRLYERNI